MAVETVQAVGFSETIEKDYLMLSSTECFTDIHSHSDSFQDTLTALSAAVWNVTDTPLERHVFHCGGCNYLLRFNLSQSYGIEMFLSANLEVSTRGERKSSKFKRHFDVALEKLGVTDIKKCGGFYDAPYADRKLNDRPGLDPQKIQTNVEALFTSRQYGAKAQAINLKLHCLKKVDERIPLLSIKGQPLQCPVNKVRLTHDNTVLIRQSHKSLLLSKDGLRRLLLENWNMRSDVKPAASRFFKGMDLNTLTADSIEPVTPENYYCSGTSKVNMFSIVNWRMRLAFKETRV